MLCIFDIIKKMLEVMVITAETSKVFVFALTTEEQWQPKSPCWGTRGKKVILGGMWKFILEDDLKTRLLHFESLFPPKCAQPRR